MVSLIDIFYGNPYEIPSSFSFYIDAYDTLDKIKADAEAKKEVAPATSLMSPFNEAVSPCLNSPCLNASDTLNKCSNITEMASGKGYNLNVDRENGETNKQWQKRTQNVAQELNDNLDGVEKINHTCKNGRIHLHVTPTSMPNIHILKRMLVETYESSEAFMKRTPSLDITLDRN
jgi:hypothetical protein